MPGKFVGEDGSEVTAFTEQEVREMESKKDEEMRAAAEKLASLEEELSKLKEKDLNFSNLRQQKDDAEKRVDRLKAEMEEKLESTKKELFEGVLKDHYDELLAALSGGDEEAKKRIEYQYKRLSDPTASKADVEKKLRDAAALAQDRTTDRATAAFASIGSAPLKASAGGRKFTDEEKAFGKALAAAGNIKLDDEDFK